MLLPNADQGILDRRAEIVSALKSMLPAGCVIDDDKSMSAFDTDGLSAYRNQPLVVVLPETTQQVADVMRWCRDNAVKIVPRGAGTSLSGGLFRCQMAYFWGLVNLTKLPKLIMKTEQ